MKERPILFSSPMVRAILEGRKTMTRRVVAELLPNAAWRIGKIGKITSPHPKKGKWGIFIHLDDPTFPQCDLIPCPYGYIGDRLWVRETYQYADWTADGYPQIRYKSDNMTLWREDHPDSWADRLVDIWAELSTDANYNIDQKAADRKWRPSIFMPRWASRITLEITDVRVERLQEITEGDAVAEGFMFAGHGDDWQRSDSFCVTWDRLNAKRGYGWDKNPWVWVIEFQKVKP